MHYLRKHLPEAGRILDAGGRSGRYALELCRSGYDVVLLDIDLTYSTFAEEKIKLEPTHVSDRLVASIAISHVLTRWKQRQNLPLWIWLCISYTSVKRTNPHPFLLRNTNINLFSSICSISSKGRCFSIMCLAKATVQKTHGAA